MRLYGKRFAKQAIEKKTRAVQETRDAILWDVDLANSTCRVKIQGSNTLVVAHYPRNWKAIPYWLKRSNAVRILHRSGNRGYIEVIGEGRAVPTPISGEALPPEETLPDGIVSGCVMSAKETAMAVIITSGTYRIDGTIYALTVGGAYVLFDSETYVFFDSETYELMQPEDGTIIKYIDAAPSVGQFRYDAFCVGIDGVIDYVKGTSSSTPAQSPIPPDHVLIGSYILVRGGVTVIESKDIGNIWTEPYASIIAINIEGQGAVYDEMPFVPGQSTQTADIVLRLKDQYNNNYSSSCVTIITKDTGGGVLSPLSVTFASSTTLTWVRDQTDSNDNDPVVFTVEGVVDGVLLTSVGLIIPELPPIT